MTLKNIIIIIIGILFQNIMAFAKVNSNLLLKSYWIHNDDGLSICLWLFTSESWVNLLNFMYLEKISLTSINFKIN